MKRRGLAVAPAAEREGGVGGASRKKAAASTKTTKDATASASK